jgi:translation initiation factor IF-2
MSEVAKKRVSSLAKQYEVTSETLIRLCQDAGLEVKSPSSMLDQPSFLMVKPLLVAEKERMERDELVKSGKKIPMKAVLKKAPPRPVRPVAPPPRPAPPRVETVITPPAPKPAAPSVAPPVVPPVASAPASLAPAAASPETPKAVAPTAPVTASTEKVAQPAPEQPATAAASAAPATPEKVAVPSVTPASAPAPADAAVTAAPQAEKPKDTVSNPAEAEAKARSLYSQLKVSVQKPDDALLARIAKARQESQARMRGGGGGGRPDGTKGYSGQLGRVPQGRGPGGGGGGGGYGGPPGGNRGGNFGGYTAPPPGGRTGTGGLGGRLGASVGGRGPAPRSDKPGTEQPRDVFAQRAHEAGVTSAGRGDRDKEKEKEKEKDRDKGAPRAPTRGRTGGGGGGGGHRKKSREQIEAELLQARNNVTKVMASLSKSPNKPKGRKEKDDSTEEGAGEKQLLQVPEFVTIGELAGLMNALPARVIAKCMELGMMVTINQRLDHELMTLIAEEFGFEAELMDEYAQETLSAPENEVIGEPVTRAPIITVMGHVDHGKTSVLDYIRKANVIAGEAGGITQHIGAYQVETAHGPICFLDTPGHEAFSAMRARGANVTDVVLLVVAADSMVMPQTKEAISLAKNSNCQLVVALNKMDLATANPDKLKTQLAEAGVSIEEWGGKVPLIPVSAKSGMGMDKLLETLALESEILELKANPERYATGTVIESRLDKGKGPVATILVQNGTLLVGDVFVTGIYSGKVRALLDERGNSRPSAGPSTPVQVLGLDGIPQSGDSFVVVEDEREAREVAARRRIAAKDRELRQKRHITLDQLYDQIKSGEFHELKIIIKGDVDGSVEAIAASLDKLSTKEVRINVISKGVGAVKDADVHLAAASDAMIVAFHVLPSEAVRELADREGVEIKNYRVIYQVVDEVQLAMEGMLKPEFREEVAGEAEILRVFRIPKVGVVAGCKVQSGIVERDLKARLYRNGIEVGEARVVSLKREKDDVKQVKSGFECGIGLEGLKDIQEGDVLAFFRKVEFARKLTPIGA